MTRGARLFALPLWVALFVCFGCGHAATPRAAGATARGYHYADNAGLQVTTLTGQAQSPVGKLATVEGRVVVERIQVGAATGAAVGHVHAGQDEHGSHGSAAVPPSGTSPDDTLDIISSASTTARVGGDSTLWRYEGNVAARTGVGTASSPADLGLEARVSTEPDYLSLSAAVTSRLDLFQQNLVLAGSVGVSHDSISPSQLPPGDGDAWPAEHHRMFAGGSAVQLLGPQTYLTATALYTHQVGTLENPYRRALVRTSLFPERVPEERPRFTGSVGVAHSLGYDIAVHVRNGISADGWGVLAWIPELGIVFAPSAGFLLDLHLQGYSQSKAWFYEPRYQELAAELSGDLRLGRIHAGSIGTHVEWRLLDASAPFALWLDAGYDLSLFDYRDLSREVFGHLATLGLRIE